MVTKKKLRIASKSSAKSGTTAAISKKRRARVGNVRALVLTALKSGEKSRAELGQITGASYNALVMHLTKLKNEGLVAYSANNRSVSLIDQSMQEAPAPKTAKRGRPEKPKEGVATDVPTPSTTMALAVGYAPRALHEALDQFSIRLNPIEALDEKLLVLDQLSSRIGGAIAVVLTDIKTDLLRIAA